MPARCLGSCSGRLLLLLCLCFSLPGGSPAGKRSPPSSRRPAPVRSRRGARGGLGEGVRERRLAPGPAAPRSIPLGSCCRRAEAVACPRGASRPGGEARPSISRPPRASKRAPLLPGLRRHVPPKPAWGQSPGLLASGVAPGDG